MKIIIDATNLKAGGGLTHLKHIVKNCPSNHKLEIVGGEWLNGIEETRNVKLKIPKERFSSLILLLSLI